MLKDRTPTAMLPTTRPDEARRFYEETLGLTFLHDNGFALVFQSGAGQLFLQKVGEFTPRSGTVLGWSLPDMSSEAAALRAKGVVFERFEGMQQDAAGVWIPPGGSGGVCWFKDPDGNLLSLSQAA